MTTANPNGALYLTSSPVLRSSRKSNPLTGLLFALLALFVLAPTLSLPATQETASSFSADDDENAGKFKEAFDTDADKEANINKFLGGESLATKEGFSYVFSRAFGIGYMNYAPKATVAGDYKRYSEAGKDEDFNCAVKPKLRGAKGGINTQGSLLYHNCDVPTLMTEFYQDMTDLVLPQGVRGGTKASVALGNNSWGNSWHTPDTVDPRASGSQKYTALELYGYNFNYTTYAGEWDHIKVTTEARALSNFGFVDRLKLGVGAAFQGAIGAIGSFSGSILNDLSSGNIFKAITCVFRCGGDAAADGAAAAVNKLIDTSDTNVMATTGWYRPDFAQTVYGVTELNNDQLAVMLQSSLIERLQDEYSKAKKENTPDDLAGFEKYSSFPAMSPVCDGTFSRSDGADKKENSWPGASGFTVPGIGTVAGPGATGIMTNKGACQGYMNGKKPASVPYKAAGRSSSPSASGGTLCKASWVPTSGPAKKVTKTQVVSGSCADWNGSKPGPLTWDVSVNYEEAESVEAWTNRTGWGDVASNYQIEIVKEIEEGGQGLTPRNAVSERDLWIGTFIKLWEDKWWGEANARAIYENQDASNKEFLQETLFGKDAGFSSLKDLFKDARNPNSPMGRYVCNDTVGNDTKLIFLYKTDGTLNDDAECPKAVRSPIQGALFGDGYLAEQKQPAQDLRRTPYTFDGVATLIVSPLSWIQEGGLFISNTTTRVSNIFLNASFSPILETLGIKGVVVEVVEGFRDSIFMPLTIIAMAIAGISILIGAMKNRAFLKAIQDVAVLLLVFLFGVLILFKPERTIDWVDKGPAWVETAIVGTIFEVGSDSGNICSAGKVRQSNLNTAPGVGLDGAQLQYNPAAGVRTMLCENWRTFALYPYVYGQWGTSYDNMADSKRTNTNETLVGRAEVPMGGGVTERNWALYQLSLQTAGSTTQIDPSTPTGNTDKNFYKVVDMQAHPNVAGAGAPDSRQFEAWTGQNQPARTMVNLMGAGVSAVGMVTVVVFSFAKITISLVSTLLILALPFMLLIGLHPTAGRSRLKSYMGRIVSLMLQRITLTFMLALMMKIITEISNGAGSFFPYMLIVTVVCLFFLTHRKDILDLFTRRFTNQHGNFGQDGMFEQPWRGAYAASPRNLQSGIQDRLAYAKGMGEDMTGGFLAGGFQGARLARMMSKDPEAALRAQGVDLDRLSDDDRRRAISEARGATRAAITSSLNERKRARRGNLGVLRHSMDATQAARDYVEEDTKETIEKLAQDKGIISARRAGEAGYDYDGKLEQFSKDVTNREVRAAGRAQEAERQVDGLIHKDTRAVGEVKADMVNETEAIRRGSTEPFHLDSSQSQDARAQERHEDQIERAMGKRMKADERLEKAVGAREDRNARNEEIAGRIADVPAAVAEKIGPMIEGSELLNKVRRGQVEANHNATRAEAERLLREATGSALEEILGDDRKGGS